MNPVTAVYEYIGSPESPLYRVGTAVDVHERRALAEEQAFLSRASRTINASLDLEQTLKNIVHQAVPELADWCEIDLFGRDGMAARFVLPEMSQANVRDLSMLELYELAGVASSIIVPLLSRERVLGWAVFMRTDSANPYDERNVPLVEEFASRAPFARRRTRRLRSSSTICR